MTATYPGNNNGGGLLIALVANKSSGVSVTVSDSASNTWNKVASSVYSDYNLEMNLFAAMNSNNSSNTVKATFGANVTSALMYIYEYRGAATSSSFDVTTATSGLSTKTPSSGFVTPTSSVELLFGATYNVTTTEIPSAASSFTLESTSTSALLLNVSVEDSTQYITGPVSADWQYTISTPSSSALIATFK
jgi:hypothetical protein